MKETHDKDLSQAFQRLKNNDYFFDISDAMDYSDQFSLLTSVIQEQPELVKEAPSVFRQVLKTESDAYIHCAHNTLETIIDVDNKLGDEVLPLFSEMLKTSGDKSFSTFYETLENITEKHPNLLEKTFPIFEEALKSPENQQEDIEKAEEVLGNILNKHPKATGLAIPALMAGAKTQNDKDYLPTFEYMLYEIKNKNPELIAKYEEHKEEKPQSNSDAIAEQIIITKALENAQKR